MKFLKESAENEPPDDKAVRIKKMYKITVQCSNETCGFWGKMEGGPMVSDPEKGAFSCPECDTINYMKWSFNL